LFSLNVFFELLITHTTLRVVVEMIALTYVGMTNEEVI
jgi:hypothetical protein